MAPIATDTVGSECPACPCGLSFALPICGRCLNLVVMRRRKRDSNLGSKKIEILFMHVLVSSAKKKEHRAAYLVSRLIPVDTK